jgi:acyl-coenzyme A synthetase/AMP-(fatty) acid ligase
MVTEVLGRTINYMYDALIGEFHCERGPRGCRPAATCGPVPGYDLKLVNDEGAELEGEGLGELHVRGASALACYWNDEEKTAASLREGWFSSRDRYRRDAEGRYWFEGRADDMFKVSDLWVSPARIEAVLMEHEAVVEAAVVGASVDGFTKPIAFVIPRGSPSEDLADELRVFCAGRLHRYEMPELVKSVADLPRTATGKIQRFQLRGSS